MHEVRNFRFSSFPR